MSEREYRSWGRYPHACHREVTRLRFRETSWSGLSGSILPRGNGRSYGDVCLNNGNRLLDVTGMDRLIHFDTNSGRIECEAGTTLAELLTVAIPHGWFLPVMPGTKFVTVGGAIANDVHGKNHHVAGSFGHHLVAFKLKRSDSAPMICSTSSNHELFRATIGGLGLTGLITSAEIQLKKIDSENVDVETRRFHNLQEFFDLTEHYDGDYEYTVAWIDSLATNDQLGRGIFTAANHSAAGAPAPTRNPRGTIGIPLQAPISLVRPLSVRIFNKLYFNKSPRTPTLSPQHYSNYFFPLDGIKSWNRLYGPRGFLQYQFVVPLKTSHDALVELLTRITRSRQGSFLSVLKIFGDAQPQGMLSFPRPGVTLALDFPIRGRDTFRLLDELDRIVADAGGAIYPAKDARMSGTMFTQSFPAIDEFSNYIDPAFSSSFWRRVTTNQ